MFFSRDTVWYRQNIGSCHVIHVGFPGATSDFLSSGEAVRRKEKYLQTYDLSAQSFSMGNSMVKQSGNHLSGFVLGYIFFVSLCIILLFSHWIKHHFGIVVSCLKQIQVYQWLIF